MTIYTLSALGLLIKLYIFFAIKHVPKKDYFYSMLAFFALHNAIELTGLFAMINGFVPLYLMKSYYSITFFVLSWLVVFSISVSQLTRLNKFIKPVIAICFLLSLFSFFTDYVVDGVENIGYTSTAIKGSLYAVFPMYAALALLITIVVLIIGTREKVTNDSSVDSFIVLIALTPLMLSSGFLILMMVLGVKINAAGIVPICTTAFLFIILKSEKIHSMTDVRRWLPYSKERQLAKEFVKLSSLYSAERIDYKTFHARIELLSLEYKYEASNQNITKMSKMMGLQRTTVYSMMRRHNFREGRD